MKKMMNRFSFKPRELETACKNEPWSHKARIVGFACLMSGISSYYQYYFDMLIFRSNQFQMAALGGEAGFEFLEYWDKRQWSAEIWKARQNKAAVDEKGFKEIKQIQMDWKTGSYEDSGTTVFTNPNGNPKDNEGYYREKQLFYTEYADKYNEIWDDYYAQSPIDHDAEAYSNWAEMHEGVMWFDTAACWKGNFIGQVNEVVIAPDTSVNTQFETDVRNPPTIPNAASDANPALNAPKTVGGTPFGNFWEGWYTGANYSNQSPNKDYAGDDAYNKLVQPKDTNGPYQ